MRLKWDEYFMLLARLVAMRSTCNSRKVGCILVKDKRVIATGYNGALPGLPHCCDMGPTFCYRRSMNIQGFEKYEHCRAVHAEANAVAQASRLGISTLGAYAYVTLFPCYSCFKLLISAGITRIYYELPYEDDRIDFYNNLANAVNVKLIQISVSEDKVKKLFEDLTKPISEKRIKEVCDGSV